jgi:type II secretory pathway component PulC
MKRLPAVMRRLPDLTLITLCAALAVRLLILLLAPDAPLAAQAVAARPVEKEDAGVARTAALVAASPFGVSVAAQGHSAGTAEALTLAGVMLAEVEADSRAILTLPGGDQRAFGVGEKLPDGRQVASVRADAVELQGAEGRSLLLLKPDASSSGRESVPSTAAAVPLGAIAPSGMVLDKREHESSRRFLAELRRDATRDPGVLASLANIEAVSDGPQRGFRLHSRNSAALLARLGLESGDLVWQVNGIRLDGPLSGLAAADELAVADELTVELVRNGAPVTVKLRVGELPP